MGVRGVVRVLILLIQSGDKDMGVRGVVRVLILLIQSGKKGYGDERSSQSVATTTQYGQSSSFQTSDNLLKEW